MIQNRFQREEIALHILVALLGREQKSEDRIGATKDDIRFCFAIAQVFEEVSDEIGGRSYKGYPLSKHSDVSDNE